VGAVVVAVVLLARFFGSEDHHHRFRFGVFYERNGDKPDDQE
jgi:hypothetical protein